MIFAAFLNEIRSKLIQKICSDSHHPSEFHQLVLVIHRIQCSEQHRRCHTIMMELYVDTPQLFSVLRARLVQDVAVADMKNAGGGHHVHRRHERH